jgi:hypothetical protein
MGKSQTAERPVIAAGRVPKAVHEEIKQAAESSGRSMAEELADLAYRTIEHRRRFPASAVAQAIEAGTLAFLLAGERYARDNGVAGSWHEDLESRRSAALSLCWTMITQFVSSDPQQQAITVEALKGRVWTSIVNGPRPG